MFFCVCVYVFCSTRSIQNNREERASHYCVEHTTTTTTTTKKKKRTKSSRSEIQRLVLFQYRHSAIFILYTHWTPIVRSGDASIASNIKKNPRAHGKRRRKMASSSCIVDRWSNHPDEKYNEIFVDIYKKTRRKKKRKKKKTHEAYARWCIQKKKKKKKEKKKRRESCSSFLLCTPSSTSKKAFSEPVISRQKEKRENKTSSLYTN